MYGHTDLRKGVMIELDGAPHQVLESSHIAMGRGGAVMRTKLKNLLTGAIFEKSFRASDKIARADVSRVNMQYLYREGKTLHLMDQSTYEQSSVGADVVGDAAKYLVEGAKVIALQFNGGTIGLEIPNAIFAEVTKTEPGAKGDTQSTALKPATIETGAEVMVPIFINEGDTIKVDTRTGTYIERKK